MVVVVVVAAAAAVVAAVVVAVAACVVVPSYQRLLFSMLTGLGIGGMELYYTILYHTVLYSCTTLDYARLYHSYARLYRVDQSLTPRLCIQKRQPKEPLEARR